MRFLAVLLVLLTACAGVRAPASQPAVLLPEDAPPKVFTPIDPEDPPRAGYYTNRWGLEKLAEHVIERDRRSKQIIAGLGSQISQCAAEGELKDEQIKAAGERQKWDLITGGLVGAAIGALLTAVVGVVYFGLKR